MLTVITYKRNTKFSILLLYKFDLDLSCRLNCTYSVFGNMKISSSYFSNLRIHIAFFSMLLFFSETLDIIWQYQ